MNAGTFEYCRLSANGVLFFNKRPPGNNSRQLANLTPGLNKTNGYLSPASARKIRAIIEEWHEAKAANFETYQKKTPFFAFVTLTLPHSSESIGLNDQDVKRQCLNRFTQYLRRKGAKYLWKAEAQANGNIHFHIVTDQFLPVRAANAVWGRCLLDAGFKVDQQNFNGLDIDQARNYEAVGAYMAKYFSSKQKDEKRRPIAGKLWGCSASLRLLKPYQVTRTLDQERVMQIEAAVKALVHEKTYLINDDNFLFIGLKRREVLGFNAELRHAAASYYSQIYGAIYQEEPNYLAVFNCLARSDLELYQAKKLQFYHENGTWHRHRWQDFTELAKIRSLGFKLFPKKKAQCNHSKAQALTTLSKPLQTELTLV